MNPSILVLCLALGAWQAKPNVPSSTAAKESTVQKGNSQHQADSPQNKESEKPQEAVGISSLEKAQPKPQPQENGGDKQSRDPLYCAYLWATIIGVGGGLIGLRLIWKQVKATEVSAEAASTNAQALMNSERAWVVVAVRGTGVRWEPANHPAEIVLSNFGKTPALVKELSVRREIVNSIQDVNGGPGNGETLDDVKDMLLAPGEPFAIPINIPQTPVGPKVVAVLGIVKYCDANGRPWYTRFLYFSNPPSHREPLIFRRIPHGYYNSYGKGYESCQPEGQGNTDFNPL